MRAQAGWHEGGAPFLGLFPWMAWWLDPPEGQDTQRQRMRLAHSAGVPWAAPQLPHSPPPWQSHPALHWADSGPLMGTGLAGQEWLPITAGGETEEVWLQGLPGDGGA